MHLTIVVPQHTARVAYVLEWIFGRQLGVPYHVTSGDPGPSICTISYGSIRSDSVILPSSGLLEESDIRMRDVATDAFQEVPVLFADATPGYDLPFDLFSAVFYLLSRYEEYLPFDPDKHNRYPAASSILYRLDCLDRPVVDEWISMLAVLLQQRGVPVKRKSYTYLPTYDIDMAWSYKNKGLLRNIGGLATDVLRGRFAAVTSRFRVLSGQEKDPFDSFSLLDDWHETFHLPAIYFILSAVKRTAYDKNAPLSHPAMGKLLRKLAARYRLGIHPSYYTAHNTAKAIDELRELSSTAGQEIHLSRQHYIKLQLPDTYRMLQEMGIREDFSMGYGSHFGFRAGTSNNFHWYDLQRERVSGLLIHPFCFMDATARYLNIGAEEAFAQLRTMQMSVQRHHGTLVTICHNFTLGQDPGWQGWGAAYAAWLQEQQAHA